MKVEFESRLEIQPSVGEIFKVKILSAKFVLNSPILNVFSYQNAVFELFYFRIIIIFSKSDSRNRSPVP